MKRSSPPHLDEQAFLLLGQTYAQCKKLAEKEFAAFGLTLAEYSLLRIIENSPRVTAVETRKRLFSSAPSVAQLVKSLEQKGLIKRTQNARDIRRQNMELTAKGKVIVAAARKTIHALLRASNISQSVLGSLVDNLTILSSSLPSYGG